MTLLGHCKARTLFLTLISASLCGIGVLIPLTWYVSIIGIALFVYTLNSLKGGAWHQYLLFGAGFGTAYAAIVLIWFWHILPLDWMDAGILGSFLVLFLSWFFVAMALGSVFFLLSILYGRFGSSSVFGSFFFASLWVLSEYAQMWLFAFLTWGIASAKSAHFSATFIGYALASFSPLLQLASIGGVYLLSFTAAFMGVSVYRLWNIPTAPKKRIYVVLIALCCAIGITTLDSYVPLIQTAEHPDEKMLRVALVTTQFSHKLLRDYESRFERHEVQKNLVLSAVQDKPPIDLLVFPEGAANFPSGEREVQEFLSEVFPQNKPAIIDSIVTFERDTRLQRMFYWTPEAELSGTYDKIFLVPQGEYTPNITYIVFRILGMMEVVEKMKRVSPGFTPGSAVSTVRTDGISIGGLFCSDVLSPQLYRQQTERGAGVLVNAASHALFHSSPIVDTYILHISKVRAVENGRYLLIAGNGVPSSVISSVGEIVMRSPKGETSVLFAHVPEKSGLTPYVALGDFILLLPALLCLIYIDRKTARVRTTV